MNFLNKHQQKLENALRAAYHEKEHTEVESNSRWPMEVMRDIRRLGTLNAQPNSFQCFNQFAWRFATVACMIVLILSIYVGITGFSPTDEISNMFLSNPVEFTLTQAVGE